MAGSLQGLHSIDFSTYLFIKLRDFFRALKRITNCQRFWCTSVDFDHKSNRTRPTYSIVAQESVPRQETGARLELRSGTLNWASVDSWHCCRGFRDWQSLLLIGGLPCWALRPRKSNWLSIDCRDGFVRQQTHH